MQPSIVNTYYANPKDRSQADITSSTASLRGTLKSLQGSLFNIFNALVRASSESREAVLEYFARVISLNVRRAGMQVDPDAVASDCFMVNLQAIMLRFCEPFMDANYTKVRLSLPSFARETDDMKIDRIDPAYYAHSSRIDLKEETRINATSEEAEQWRQKNAAATAPPNFISDIFYLTLAMNHYGYQKTISTCEDLAKQHDEMSRHLETLEGDGRWRGVSAFEMRAQSILNHCCCRHLFKPGWTTVSTPLKQRLRNVWRHSSHILYNSPTRSWCIAQSVSPTSFQHGSSDMWTRSMCIRVRLSSAYVR